MTLARHPWKDEDSLGALSDVEQSIPACFERQALAHGARRALGSGGWQPTYGELNAAANRLAHRLMSHGSAGDRVAILMRHGPQLLAAVLAVLKAARIVVVLNEGEPLARLERMLDHADPGLILFDETHGEFARTLAGSSRLAMGAEAQWQDGPSHNPETRISPHDIAVLIYTSGTTGRSKAVMQNHRNLLHTVRGFTRGLHFRPEDRISLLGSLSGGQGMMTAFCALLNGAALFPYRIAKEGTSPLAAWLERHRITVFISAATVFRHFVNTLDGSEEFPHMRLVRLGAEPVLRADLEAWRRLFPADCKFANVLSSAETGNLTQLVIDRQTILEGDRVPVGWPVKNKKILLLDDSGREAGTGECGEIVVRSCYLSPGYWRDPAQTAASFETVAGSDERIYRTGDLGRWREDGALEHMGRKGTRIKVMGHGVEPAEVEAMLLDQPEVAGAAVCVQGHDGAGGRLVAFVTLRPGARVGPALAEALKRKLPAHMIPARMEFLDSLPLTANGKPDRQHLLERFGNDPKTITVLPRTELESRIATVWRRAFHRDTIGVYESFFEMGGDSLQAVDLMLSLSGELAQNLSISLLVRYSTIAQMAHALESGVAGAEKERWFRWWRVSLMALRQTGDKAPLVFIPGGYGTENELFVICASMLPHLDTEHPVYGARLNFIARRRVVGPFSVRGVARKIARQVLELDHPHVPVVIGDCRACPLALETAEQLSQLLGRPPRLLLLDPWQPRQEPQERPAGAADHPSAIPKYFRLLDGYEPGPYAGEVHVICSEASARLPLCLKWWESRLRCDCRGHEVPGDHHSYIRQHRAELAGTINAICDGAV